MISAESTTSPAVLVKSTTAPEPGFRRLPGRTSTSQKATRFVRGSGPPHSRSKNTSAAPPVPRLAPSRRAGMTRVSLATSKSPGCK